MGTTASSQTVQFHSETIVRQGDSGYIAMTINCRHFGTSGGEPRARRWPLLEIKDVKSAIHWLEDHPGVRAPALTIESFERGMDFDAVYAAAKIAARAHCVIELSGRDVYHPSHPVQTACRSAGEPKQMMSIPIDPLDCYKPDGRAKTTAVAVAFFDTHLES